MPAPCTLRIFVVDGDRRSASAGLAAARGMTTKDAKSIATEMLTAWTSGDFAHCRALLHDDATFDGPLGQTRGGDKYIEGVRGFAKTIDRVQIHKAIAEGEDVCLVYDLVTRSGAEIPTVGIYRIEAGNVHSVRAYFDPRPLVK